jgi:hypothetical protein
VICSTSIERIVTGRNAAIAQIETLIHQLDEYIDTNPQHRRKKPMDWAMEAGFCYGCWLMEKPEAAMRPLPAISIAVYGGI